MPTYLYICDSCKTEKEIIHRMSEDPEFKCECGTIMRRGIIPNFGGVILKGNSWTGKNIRIKEQMLKKRREVGKKMVKNRDIPQILANYKGEVCDSWDDARLKAKSAGENMASYDKSLDTFKKEQNTTKEKLNDLAKGKDVK